MFRVTFFIVGLLCANLAFSAIVVGNAQGVVTLVEVYDYQCAACHQEYPVIQQLMRENRNLKIRFIPTAVVNQRSIYQAAAAIAATQYPNRFQAFNRAALTQPPMTQQAITQTLRQLGLTGQQFIHAMHSKPIEVQMMIGRRFLDDAHSGTPLLMIYPSNQPHHLTVLKGYQSYKVLQQVIDHE